ncbi:autotransporter-associated beta strand repeat-containing protein [Formosa sp. A9]|uniref:rhamnogalacturonan lyase family protein n=1 Tax=Formosa sp. A9 TaxID=3442641 RepID=UPI003EB7FCDF
MKKNYVLTVLLLVLGVNFCVSQRQLENLNRGLVAVRTSESDVYVAWRLLGYENPSTSFNVYRDGVLLNDSPIVNSTNYLDQTSNNASYQIKPVINGNEQEASETVQVWAQNYLDIPLSIPVGGTTSDGVSYSYTANDASVGDLDGDGTYEIILKWDPTNSKDNSHEGYTGNVYLDAYTLEGELKWRIDLGRNIRAGAHYTQFIVFDLDGDGKSEIACKTADGTKDGQGKVIGDANADYRNSAGRILEGPEFLTVFNGETGAEMATVDYLPARGSVSSWGDNYGNRVDRFLAGVAYLDGKHPSLVMCRGYYTRSVLAAWDWQNGKLTQRWIFDSNDEANKGYAGQGNHSLSIADVDADGKDEIIYGSMTVDDDGTGLYTTGLGHGDALHVSDFDPTRPGQEVFMPHENKVDGITFRSAATGDIIWQYKMNTDVGRGLIADIDPDHLGAESWASSGLGVYNVKGEQVQTSRPSINFAIWWDDDLQRELLDGTSIAKYGVGEVFNAVGCSSNNSTKKTPNLQADLFGDWREEVVLRTNDNSALRIFLNPTMSTRKLYTLMHDPQYRMAIAWQNVGYNQPPWPSFYLGTGMDAQPPAPINNNKLIWKTGSVWDIENSTNWVYNQQASVFHQNDIVLFEDSGNASDPINLSGNLEPTSVTFNSSSDYNLQGDGQLSGAMSFIKMGSGNTTLNNPSNSYTGTTTVWQGGLFVHGALPNSAVEVKDYATFGGTATLGASVQIGTGANVFAGGPDDLGEIIFNEQTNIKDAVNFNFDLSENPSAQNDKIVFNNDVAFEGTVNFNINILQDGLNTGTYTLIEYNKAFNLNLDAVNITGIPGIKYELKKTGQAITMEVEWVRNPTTVYWRGTNNNVWDLAETYNWYNGNDADLFAPSDTVIFDDSATENNTVETMGTLPIAAMVVDSDSDYYIQGEGDISGTGGLKKQGSGTLFLKGAHSFTGETVIEDGTLALESLSNSGELSALGSGSGAPEELQINGGTLAFLSNIETNRGFSVLEQNGSVSTADGTNAVIKGEVSGAGVLEKYGNGQLALHAKNTLTGEVILKEGTIYLGSEESIANGFGDGTLVLEGGILNMLDDNNSYSKAYWNVMVPEGKQGELKLDSRCEYRGSVSGAGTLNLYSPWIRSEMYGDWSNFTGQVNVTTDGDGGWFILGNTNGYEQTSINLSDGLSIVFRLDTNAIISIGELTGSANTFLSSGYGGKTLIWKVGTKNTNAVFNGSINNDSFKGSGSKTGIIKAGTGTWTLTSASTYTEGTTIESGELIVENNSGSATGTGDVTVKTDAILSGTGIVNGNVILESKAILAPGGQGQIGQLTGDQGITFLEDVELHIEIGNSENDKLIVGGTLACNGILHIVNTGSDFKEGDEYEVFQAMDITGSFSKITPELADNLAWDDSELYSKGILKVADKDKLSISEDILKDGQITMYPNPTNDNLHITLKQSTTNTTKLYLYDYLGHMLYQTDFSGEACTVDLVPFSKGMYIIQLKNTSGIYNQTIVKN